MSSVFAVIYAAVLKTTVFQFSKDEEAKYGEALASSIEVCLDLAALYTTTTSDA